jgi:CubicO group peptidase (beta-lactamase class C family)
LIDTAAVIRWASVKERDVFGEEKAEPLVCGEVNPAFHHVGVEFERNFRLRGEQGAACTVYYRGEKVVDLWGGYQCAKARKPWDEGTLTLVFSVTKGMAAAAMVVAHSRGLFELDECVSRYWPEFAQQGKQSITVRQLLAHQAGLISVDRFLNATTLADHNQLADILAAQPPQWKPGRMHGYHTLTLGWYQSELIRRTDPRQRSLGEFFQDEIANPLGIEFYIGLPETVCTTRISNVKGYHRIAILGHLNQLPTQMVLAGIWPRSLVAKSVKTLRLDNPARIGGPDYRAVEIPSANGIGQAGAVAKVYDVLRRGGHELGVTPQTYRELIAPAVAPQKGTFDAILKIPTYYGFGFSRPSSGFSFGSDASAFGCPGAGGSFGMADPAAELSFAYLTNKMSFRIFDDPREKAMRQACYGCVDALRRQVAA